MGVWRGVRVGSIATHLTVIALLLLLLAAGLFVMFHVIIPSLPILFFAAPWL